MFASTMGLPPGSDGSRADSGAAVLERFRTTPGTWLLAAVLLLAAAYFIVRLLELDVINEKTPNQDDPLSKPPGSP